MARAGLASASAHPDSIKGLAQSIANPAYRRLLNAEPLLRRAVPVLIIAFLLTICVGALVQLQLLAAALYGAAVIGDVELKRFVRGRDGKVTRAGILGRHGSLNPLPLV